MDVQLTKDYNLLYGQRKMVLLLLANTGKLCQGNFDPKLAGIHLTCGMVINRGIGTDVLGQNG